METDEEYSRAFRERNPFLSDNMDIVKREHDGCVMKAVITDYVRNRYGTVHGGLIFTLIDCVCGLAAIQDGRSYVTQSADVHFLGNVREGVIYGKSTVLKRGSRIAVVHGEVTAEDGTLLAEATVNMYCPEDR